VDKMQHVIIGTAGHIDHGKTTLIKALTGRDTDTLKEEKDRGISINLGFTYFDLPSGKRAGIVDVPGHEKFIKNALAGIGGIDLVLLVIAADEGIMPQTREHLNILELLDIKNGIIVLTKTDLVDSDWLSMVTEEVKREVSSTFLKASNIIPVDSISGKGMEKLINKIDEMTKVMEDRDISSDFRIPVDRVFTISGFGTVITGTLVSGTVSNGDPCQIYTKEINSKIRNLQVHEHNVETAYSGQRVAINLASISKEEIERGDVLARQGSMKNTMMLDCRLIYLKDAPRPLNNRDRVRVYTGTTESLGRVVILDKETVNPGESALIQIRLEGPVAVKRSDKYVIRSYSPLFTIGGGTILDPNPVKHKLKDEEAIKQLLIKEIGTPEEIVEQVINNLSSKFPKKEDVLRLAGNGIDNLDEIIEKLLTKGIIHKITLDGDIFLHKNYLIKIKNKAENILNEFHGNNPLKSGISREEFKNKLFGTEIKQKLYDKVLELLAQDTLSIGDNIILKKTFSIKLSTRQEQIESEIIKAYTDNGFLPPRIEDLLKAYGREEKAAKIIFYLLLDKGSLIKISDELYLTIDNYNKAKDKVINFINLNGEITVAQYRDEISTNRKHALAILDHLDQKKLTKRQEDKRVLL
jgi:selenocysteine-specific elongation factor